jgi:hypothetical protein
MRPVQTLPGWLPLLAAGAFLALPQAAGAQAFTANYALSRPVQFPSDSAVSLSAGLFDLGLVRVAPALRGDGRYSGAGLSFEAGRNWFAEVGLGRGLQLHPEPASAASGGVLSVSGGYRWTDGQALSMQLTGGRGADRLGLAVSYDWPRYFVRLSYDSRFNLVPTDTLRFSAGVRF